MAEGHGGHYGPLVIAWGGLFPQIGARVPVVSKHEGVPANVLFILREATREEYLACCQDRGFQPVLRPGQRFYEVHTD